MQTFMPHADFAMSAKSLDDARLNKQRVEAKQIIQVLEGTTNAWRNHPAVVMWRGYERSLADYGLATCIEWTERGGADRANLTDWFAIRAHDLNEMHYMPEWVYNADLNMSHRSNLVRKDEAFYRPQFRDVPSNMPYLWPVWDEYATAWTYRLSVSESHRSGWVLPDYLKYDPKTRYVGFAA